jgi:Ulp1 family protease
MDLGGDKKHGTIIKPYIIVLNSVLEIKFDIFKSNLVFKLIDPAVDKHIEVRSQLAEYLSLEFDNKHSNSVNKYVKDELKVVQPTLIPQQKGYIDCGLFLLHFAELFLTTPPEVLHLRPTYMQRITYN